VPSGGDASCSAKGQSASGLSGVLKLKKPRFLLKQSFQ